jgi:hypothetical protein
LTIATLKFTHADYFDTYFYHYNRLQAGDADQFRLIMVQIWADAFDPLGVALDLSKTQVWGVVAWITPDAPPAAIGCATVTVAPGSGQVFYADDSGLPTTERTSTNPVNGVFIVVNVEPGSYTLTGDVDGNTEEFMAPDSFAGSLASVEIQYPSSTFPTNPTPAGCE